MTSRLMKAAAECSVTKFLHYREYLLAVYEYLKGQEASFSYRQFSEVLDLSPDNASWLIVTGRRKISPTVCQAIIKQFGLKNIERQYFEILVKYNNSRKGSDHEDLLQKLVTLRRKQLAPQDLKDKLEYFTKWQYPVLREMVGLADFKSDPTWISKKLLVRLLPAEAEEALQLLEGLGLIEYDKTQKRHVQKGGDIAPSEDTDGIAIMRFHQVMLQLAEKGLGQLSDNEFDVNALTLRLSPEAFSTAQNILREAFLKIYRLEGQAPTTDRLYQVNFQLFPLTKEGSKEENS